MEQLKHSHGGRRPGSGRPANDRNIMVGVRISQQAADILNRQANKSEFIDALIKQSVNNEKEPSLTIEELSDMIFLGINPPW